MRTMRWMLLAALALIVATPCMAGEKCEMSTQECLDYMTTRLKESGWVGVELDIDEDSGTYAITRVVPGSPAESAGMHAGDVLFAMYGIPMTEKNQEQLKKARADWKPGQSVTYTIKRDGADHDITLTLAPMPADVLAQWIGAHMMEHVSAETETARAESDGS